MTCEVQQRIYSNQIFKFIFKFYHNALKKPVVYNKATNYSRKCLSDKYREKLFRKIRIRKGNSFHTICIEIKVEKNSEIQILFPINFLVHIFEYAAEAFKIWKRLKLRTRVNSFCKICFKWRCCHSNNSLKLLLSFYKQMKLFEAKSIYKWHNIQCRRSKERS